MVICLPTYVYPSQLFSFLQVFQQKFCTNVCTSCMNATFSTHPILIYVARSTNYESHCYAVCPSVFLSLLAMSKCSPLQHTLHLANLQTHFTVSLYFLCKRVYTSCKTVTVVLLWIHVLQDVTLLFGFTI
jgi:hypothetical protein